MSTKKAMSEALSEARRLLDEFVTGDEAVDFLVGFSDQLVNVFKNGGKVFIAGNGGSHCDALHFAEEFTGRYRSDRRALPAMALGEAAHTTCVGNDYGFEYIFSRQIEAFGKSDDLLIVLSTSGNSENLCQAVNEAHKQKMKTVGLLGKGGGTLAGLVNSKICVPGETSDRIQELHMMLLHMVIEAVERELFPENYV